jgi:hypothetical protein
MYKKRGRPKIKTADRQRMYSVLFDDDLSEVLENLARDKQISASAMLRNLTRQIAENEIRGG